VSYGIHGAGRHQVDTLGVRIATVEVVNRTAVCASEPVGFTGPST
jgi:hypothetical protein